MVISYRREIMMLSNLKLVEAPKHKKDPLVQAKEILLDRLDEQLQAVTNMVNRKPSELTERQKWYYKIDNVMYFKVKLKNKTLVLGKDGQTELTRVEIGQDQNAPAVVQEVIEAVQNGELDQAIAGHLK